MQQPVNGIAVGCVYGLIALGFVLIYKATEVVNFAQGDLLMLGAFVAYTFIVWWGLDYWIGFLLAVGRHGAVRRPARPSASCVRPILASRSSPSSC